MPVKFADIIFGASWGDEGKGKITAALAKNRQYDFVCRWGGGNNAGHTVYVDDRKFVTHLVPSGIFYGIPSVIGPGCVVHPESLFRELAELADGGFDTRLLKIDPRCHVVTESHLQWEAQGTYAADLGTTKRGIGPAYADKAYRTGIQAKDVPALSAHLLQAPVHGNILCEGAQGIWLDLDWGSYPYVTSSTTAPHGACSIGFSVRQIRNIIGVAKAYDTRVGTDPNFPESLKDDPQLQLLQKAGSEYGATTGRIRKCNWLNLDYLNQAVQLSGMSHLIINKVDILRDVGIFQFYWKNQLYSFDSISAWLLNVQSILMRDNPTLHVTFSMSPTFESGMVGQIFLNSLM